jgi:hypothetical protein
MSTTEFGPCPFHLFGRCEFEVGGEIDNEWVPCKHYKLCAELLKEKDEQHSTGVSQDNKGEDTQEIKRQ